MKHIYSKLNEETLYSFYRGKYIFLINGKKELWKHVWFVNRPLIWENHEKTKILIVKDWINQFEIFELFEISYENFIQVLKKSQENEEKEVLDFTRSTETLINVGYKSKTYYCTYKDWGNLQPFNKNKLLKTKPELFI